MDSDPAPEPTDLSLQLPRSTYWQLVHMLRGMLPDPEDGTPEALAHRDHAAIAQVAAMLPANADEAFLAAQCVGARLYGMDCIRDARRLAKTDPMWQRKCAAQGFSAFRESRQARSLLARLQAAREKREALCRPSRRRPHRNHRHRPQRSRRRTQSRSATWPPRRRCMRSCIRAAPS